MEILRTSLIESLTQRNHVLFEETFSKLVSLSDANRMARSKPLIARFKGLSQDIKDKQAVTTWDVPSASNKNKVYKCLIGISVQGGLFSLAKNKWDAKVFSEALSSAEIKVHCNCPDFYWSGMKYNLGPNGKLKGNTFSVSSGYKDETPDVTHAPDKRDPNRKHVLCKHLLTIFPKFHANAFDIMKQAKAFDANPVDGTTQTTTSQKKKIGSKKIIDEKNNQKSTQEIMRDELTGKFADSVINLHESGKLNDDLIDPSEIIPNNTNEQNKEVESSELVNIDNTDVPDDFDIKDIVPEPEITQPEQIESDQPSQQDENVDLTKDDPNKEKVDPSEIVGS